MKRTTDKTYSMLYKMFVEGQKKLSHEEADKKALEVMKDPKTKMRYYVTTFGYDLCDISSGAMVKTPAKYFDNLNHAKIYQLKGILAWAEAPDNIDALHAKYTYNEVEDMYSELKELSIEYPEYVL